MFNRLELWQPFIIGLAVVSAGALTEKLNSPMWLIIVIPFPIGITLLLSFLQWDGILWLSAYGLTLFYYIIFHIFLSYVFKFDSLIPAWKLHT
ncbi:hypothetical protein U2I54_19000 [Bacillus pseudomycoides]|uniref:Uncharacterized protein n=1 Tax=Bacillus bingmayongensis TaxID=1150157 RepID=A0ABU5K086_9BACI|nr:hypothetical protein [Bacillus pseudomycoides]